MPHRISTTSLLAAILFTLCSTAFAAETAKPRIFVWKTYPFDNMCTPTPIWEKLQAEGFEVVTGAQIEVNAATLAKFNAVIVTDLFSDPNLTNKGLPAEIERYGKLLDDYVKAGGTLWIFGRSMHHMSHPTATDALNKILAGWGAEVLPENVRDADREKIQERYMKMRYASTGEILKDDLTAGIEKIWYPNGVMVGITSPLKLSDEWKPLIKASGSATTLKLGLDGNAYPCELENQPGTAGQGPVIVATRKVGEGRIILAGLTSTVPFWGYKHVMWEDIATTNGINDRSDWMKFFVQSVKIPGAQSKTGGGELKVAPIALIDPQPSVVKDWADAMPAFPAEKTFKGVIGASTALSDGKGTVADFAAAARKSGVDFIIFSEDLKTLTAENYKKLVEECHAATTAEFAAIPGIKYQDVDGNRRIIVGEKCWPSAKRLFPPDKTIFGPVWLYFDSGSPMQISYDFSHANYPAYTNVGLNAMGVRSYENGVLFDDAVASYLDNQHRADCLTPVIVNLSKSPESLANIKEWYFVPAEKIGDFVKLLNKYPGWYEGWKAGYVSDGPVIRQWAGVNLRRTTGGRYYVPGTERWRVALKATSEAPITTVEILDGENVIRTYRPNTPTCDIVIDGLHDMQRVLIARITDANGREAITSGLTISDTLFEQGQCSDHQNFMAGRQDYRTADDKFIGMQATAMLAKATRPTVGNVQTSDPALLNPIGVDGGAGTTFALFCPMMVRGKSWDEFRYPVFKNGFRYASRDALVFDLTYTHRIGNDCAPWPSIESGDPWGRMEPAQHFTAKTTWINFPRRLNNFSPSVVEFEMNFQRAVSLSKICDPDQGRALFWTHRLGFHHPEFRFKGLKGVESWDEPKSNTYTDTLPALLLGAAEGEASPGQQDRCTVLRTGDGDTTIKAGEDAAHPNAWQGTMKPGEALLLHPNLGGSGGFFLLNGDLQSRVELGYDWLRVYLGLYDLRSFKAGESYNSRILTLQGRLDDKDPVADWKWFRDTWGLAGDKPAYSLNATKGKILGTQFLLECQSEKGLVALSIGEAALSQRLPIKINGLSPNLTAAIVDNTRKEWLPIGVTAIEAYATHDAGKGASDLVIGNIVSCNNPDLVCTLLPEGDKFVIDIHNPTDKPASVTISVPAGLWMIKAGTQKSTVPAGTTARLAWEGN